MSKLSDLTIYPPQQRRKYPHMLPEEVTVWNAFLELHAHEFNGFAYDVHVGRGQNPKQFTDPNMQKMVKAITRYRIDVVGFMDTGLLIIEIKPVAGMKALGQVLGYVDLFVRDFNPKQPVRGAVVANTINPDLRDLLRVRQIEYFTVP